MDVLLATAIALLAGLLVTRVFKYLHLDFPDVTAFLLAGLLVGPYVLGRLGITGLGFLDMDAVDSLSVLTNTALGFIAFAIGNEFRLSQLRDTGKKATVIGIVQAVMATLLVDAVLIGLSVALGGQVLPLPAAIILGAIASATAPAATLMVVRQYKAKGPLTDLLLPIVALDDAVGLILFTVSFGIAQAVQGGELNIISVLANPLIEIIGSLVLGALMGLLLTMLEKLFFSNSNRLSLSISFVVLTIALSSEHITAGPFLISFSPLLVCMMLGTVFCNLSAFSGDIMNRADKWTAPLFATFFVVSGAGLELSVFRYPVIILIGIVYILVRCAGKYLGAFLSSTVTGCEPKVRKYLGITLFPQAGVALGMVVTAQAIGGESASLIKNIILFSVLIYELIGPLLTRMALNAASEIGEIPAEKRSRSRFADRNRELIYSAIDARRQLFGGETNKVSSPRFH
ncbi:MAG: cation:proton antiporter [Clostridia bacterium]|nr:cation:proton antiporter [Clostridia bacterium]